MKVLSGHGVTKSLSERDTDLLIMPASAVHMNMGYPVLQQTQESMSANSSQPENINRKRWMNLFRGVQKNHMNVDVGLLPKKPLFGKPLSEVCEENGSPPKPIMEILIVLQRDGPNTEGVFRKAGNARALKEIKEQLNNGEEVELKNKPIILLADLLKDFLRQLPGSLLVSGQYQTWMAAMQNDLEQEKCAELKLIINKLPEPNIQLLKCLISMLHHISVGEDKSKMDSNSLAVCVSPNLLQVNKVEMFEHVKDLTKFLIDNCCEIFGEDVLTLLEDPDEEDFSNNQDSLSLLHHDSAYESNDPDGDCYNENYTDTHEVYSDAEDNTPEQASSSPDSVARPAGKPFTRRCSDPTIAFKKGGRKQSALFRSQTETDFYEHHLRKQMSDECVLFKKCNGLPVQKNSQQHTSKDCSCCSSSSLDSTFSTASESSVQSSSPIITCSSQRLQRKQSFPNRPTVHALMVNEANKKRSQSMKSTSARSKVTFSRGGASRPAQKILRHSQTLPEVLHLNKHYLTPNKPRRVSSEEVFQEVDSKKLGEPPSYKHAVQDIAYTVLLNALTVEVARSLSEHTCCQTTFQTEEPANSCLMKSCPNVHVCRGGDSNILVVTGTSLETGLGSLSETTYETLDTNLICSQQLLQTLNVRESYV